MESGNSIALKFSKAHKNIPSPFIGQKPIWDMHKLSSNDSKDDHRKCPAIQRRNELGITLSMPYSVEIFRDGDIQISNLKSANDKRIFKFNKFDSDCVGVTKDLFQSMHRTLIDIPLEGEGKAMKMFMVGDDTLNSWIIDSGIIIESKIPENYQYLIAPLPYRSYPNNISIGQGIAFRTEEPGRVRHLKIPIDFEFPTTPNQARAVNSIKVSRGEPMVQWILIDAPSIKLIELATQMTLKVNF